MVAKLTGYPFETLSLEMDMEADLGIDSIKRVEILSMLAKRIPGAPSVNPESLSKLRTLGQVLRFVSERPANGAEAPTPPVASNGHAARVAPDHTSAPAAALLHRQSVVPVAAPVSQEGVLPLPEGPVLITADDSGFADALARGFAMANRTARVIRPGDDLAGPVGTLVLLAPDDPFWTQASESRLKVALGLARSLGPRLREGGAQRASALLVTVSRRDGAFGFATRAPQWNALQGGLAGLAKSAAHEWPEVRCRALDVSHIWSLEAAARAVVDELAHAGPREVGLGPAGRVTLALLPQDALPLAHRFDKGGVVVVTGGARGVTAECARALALRTGSQLVLLGRTPVPADEPFWLREATSEAEESSVPASTTHRRGSARPPRRSARRAVSSWQPAKFAHASARTRPRASARTTAPSTYAMPGLSRRS